MPNPRSRANPRTSMDFNRLIPWNFKGQDVNGSLRAGNQPGWNRDWEYEAPQVEKTGTWKNGNRSGE